MPDEMNSDNQAGRQPAPGGSQDDKTMATLAHLLGIISSFVGPLIIWLIKKDESAFVNDQAKEALNFQITVLIAWVAAGALLHLGIGFLLYPSITVANVIFCIMAGVKANEGVSYRYPFTLRLIK